MEILIAPSKKKERGADGQKAKVDQGKVLEVGVSRDQRFMRLKNTKLTLEQCRGKWGVS